MSAPETSSSSSSPSTPYTLPPPTSMPVTVAVIPARDLSNAEIEAIFPGIQFVDAENPGPDNRPTPPDNFWAIIGWKVTNYVTVWFYKKFGWLLIIEALENGGETPED